MNATYASWSLLPEEQAQPCDILVQRIVILQKGWNIGTQRRKRVTLSMPRRVPSLEIFRQFQNLFIFPNLSFLPRHTLSFSLLSQSVHLSRSHDNCILPAKLSLTLWRKLIPPFQTKKNIYDLYSYHLKLTSIFKITFLYSVFKLQSKGTIISLGKKIKNREINHKSMF